MVELLDAYFFFFFFEQKTAYELRISDWSSDVCSSDLDHAPEPKASRGHGSDHIPIRQRSDRAGAPTAAAGGEHAEHVAGLQAQRALVGQALGDRKSVV